MRRLVSFLILSLFATLTLARPTSSSPPQPVATVPLQPTGYVFSNPQLLAQQIVWGLAHGVNLLGRACQEAGHAAAAEAHLNWLPLQTARIHAAERDLARHYFKQESASVEAIRRALLLKERLEIRPDELPAACDSLPEALRQERYDLDKVYAGRRAAIEKGDPDFPGAVWIEPVDTLPPPQEAMPIEAEKEKND